MTIQQIRKNLYRAVRYNPIVEAGQNRFRRSNVLALPEISKQLEVAPGEIIIDCGANVGDLTSRFARTGASVYAFEPNPDVFTMLSHRFTYLPSVKCLNQGVMDKVGKLELEVPVPDENWDALETSVSGSFMREGEFASGTRKFSISCINLVEFIASLDAPVRLLKLDIEGAEIPVLNDIIDSGAIDRIEYIVAETHEEIIPELADVTNKLRTKISEHELGNKINLNWD